MKNIFISNLKDLEEKIKKISKDGVDKFHVITDFDRTLTKAFVDGEKSPTVIAQIRNGKYLTEDYSSRAHKLFDIYHPIEIDHNIPLKEKDEKMLEWWMKHFDLLIECGMNKEIIQDIIKNKKIEFRKGALKLLEILNKNNIPLIIMSAGPGDMIKEYLRSEGKLYENIHIVANFFKWGKDGKAIDIEKPIIHSLNKHEIEIKGLNIYDELTKRTNVLLLGDNLEDIGMIEGFPYKELIKVCFLNENAEKRKKYFLKNYDVVITEDGDMDYVNKLLIEII